MVTRGVGGYFESSSFMGIIIRSADYAVHAQITGGNTATAVLYGENQNTGYGVHGISVSNHGVYGISTSGRGVYGESTSDYGVYGKSTSGRGVYGQSTADGSYAIFGKYVGNTGYAGYFDVNPDADPYTGIAVKIRVNDTAATTVSTCLDIESTGHSKGINISTGNSACIEGECESSTALDLTNDNSTDTIVIRNNGSGGGLLSYSDINLTDCMIDVNVGSGNGSAAGFTNNDSNDSACWADNNGGDYAFEALTGSYGGFTGSHKVLLVDDFPLDYEKGMIVYTTGKSYQFNTSTVLVEVQLCSTINNKSVFGVIVSDREIDKKIMEKFGIEDENKKTGVVNSLGDGLILVTNYNGNIEAGDYITSSVISGYGILQDDDLLHNYTVAKATESVNWDEVEETIEYDGGTYKRILITCAYHC